MEDAIDENTKSMRRLLREMHALAAQQEEYRKHQMAKFRARQECELKEANQIKEKIREEDEKVEMDAATLREETEIQIKIMRDNLEHEIKIMKDNIEKEQERRYAKLQDLEQAINADRHGTIVKIEEYNAAINAKKKKVSQDLDELHEASKRLMDHPDEDATNIPKGLMDFDEKAPSPQATEPEVASQSLGIHKRAGSDHSSDSAHDRRKRPRQTSSAVAQDADVVQEEASQAVDAQQDATTSPSAEKESAHLTPTTTQSAQKPKGLILAPWQKNRLVNYADIRGKEYVYIRHNVPRVLRCPDCADFNIWPTRPTIKGLDKAHFMKSEIHRQQREMDGDVGPGRGRENGAEITSDWITRRFGWRVVNGIPKGSLDEWAVRHNEEVDRCRNGEVITDIVFEPEQEDSVVVEEKVTENTPSRGGRKRGRSGRSRSSVSALEPITPITTTRSEDQTPERKVPASPESITRAAAREGGYSMRNIARRNYTVPGIDDIRDKARA